MPRPTKTGLAKHPRAVVILSAPMSDREAVVHDFEWFDTDEGVATFMQDALTWATEDLRDNGDMQHLIAEVKETKFPPTVGDVHVVSGNADEAAKWKAKIEADTTLLVSETAPRGSKATTTKVKPKVKPRRPSAAAAVLKAGGEAKPSDDAAKAKADKQAALKARLAAKKAGAIPQEAPKDDGPKPKSKPKPDEAKQALYVAGLVTSRRR